MAWTMILKPVIDGGLGIRDITTQNEAALNNLVWRFVNNRSEWWSRLMCQKYLRHSTFTACTPRPTDSTLWKAPSFLTTNVGLLVMVEVCLLWMMNGYQVLVAYGNIPFLLPMLLVMLGTPPYSLP